MMGTSLTRDRPRICEKPAAFRGFFLFERCEGRRAKFTIHGLKVRFADNKTSRNASRTLCRRKAHLHSFLATFSFYALCIMLRNTMKFRTLLMCAALGLSSASLVACSDDPVEDNGGNGGGGNGDGNGSCPEEGTTVEIRDSITTDTTWCATATYNLNSLTYIENGATLTIEPGTKITGLKGAALVSTQEGKLISEGTPENPIVFTSTRPPGQAEAGDWGGVVMLGNALINVPGGTNQIEGIDPGEGRATYGGDDDAHNCGTVAYTRIEYAGDIFGQDNELNGLTLGGCGTQTQLHHIQVIDGLDDGIEFFGGAVDLNYAVVTNPGDDGVDWDEGYRGRMQFIVVEMEAPNSDDPRAFEWDGLRADHNAEPLAHVVMANATIYQTGEQPEVAGAKIRRGAGADLFNILAVGFSGDYLDVESAESGERVTISGMGFFGRDEDPASYVRDESEENNAGSFNEADHVTVAGHTISVPYPENDSPAATAGVDGPTDSWFVPAKYLGAFDPSKPAAEQWDAGWTR